MRSYGHYCGLAKTLDVVGDRWSLLIVRELLMREACRYTDLRDGLPGIATNLLADRLRQLERAGVIEREVAPPPIAATLFRLTERGEQLRGAVHALGRWGAPLMAAPCEGDAFRSHWLSLPVEILLEGRVAPGPPATIELRAGAEPVAVEIGEGTIRTRLGPAGRPDLVLAGHPQLIFGVLTGMLELHEALDRGLECEGDVEVLGRVQPRGEPIAS